MDYLTAWVIMVPLLDGQSLSEESFFFSYCRDMLKMSGGWYRVMSKKAQRSKQIERSCKKLYLEERKSKEITREMRKMSQGASPYYYRGMKQIDDIQYFLELRNEAERIYSNYIRHRGKWIEYVKGGGTFFYTPMKKKERRKALRKHRLFPLSYYMQIQEEDKKYMEEKS